MNENVNKEFKIILLGNSGVGKTAIIERYAYNRFNQEFLTTVGLNYITKTIELKNNKKIELKIWDTAGQEKFRSLSKSYFRNVDAVLFVFAINDIESFESIKDWIKIFKTNHNGKDDIPLYLIENKNDLTYEIERNVIDDFLNENKNLKFKSTSAKLENDKINELFQELGEILYNNYFKGDENRGKQQYSRLLFKPTKRKKPTCCFVK